ncbi:hypothetical protein [Actinomadura rudentiformis]|uniref:Uncharacterized protein n=1 Tax=Actinomadura rudentiformis TaxID=359158 RepID=A0A6H9YMY4_9ACTN|nr:hypothetical protein [Actinomadura rudentiformis]KAB2347362.1 hypothetical protein F8566_20330 [Actinomadura rudentiformis]
MTDPHVDVPAEGEDVNEIDLMDQVDAHPDAERATEDDEKTVLGELYGEPVQGIYTGGEA